MPMGYRQAMAQFCNPPTSRLVVTYLYCNISALPNKYVLGTHRLEVSGVAKAANGLGIRRVDVTVDDGLTWLEVR